MATADGRFLEGKEKRPEEKCARKNAKSKINNINLLSYMFGNSSGVKRKKKRKRFGNWSARDSIRPVLVLATKLEPSHTHVCHK